MPRPTCEYGKKIKHALIDLDQNQAWLLDELNQRGYKMNSGNLGKILVGELKPADACKTINELLSIED